MSSLFFLGRLLFGLIHVFYGLRHFWLMGDYAKRARKRGVPLAKSMVTLTGALLIVGGLSIITLRYFEEGIWLLLLFYLPTTLLIHEFWREKGKKRTEEFEAFMKNMVIVGALLMMLILTEVGALP